jgi:hypothetical protein
MTPAFVLHGKKGSFLKHRADVQEDELKLGKVRIVRIGELNLKTKQDFWFIMTELSISYFPRQLSGFL